MQLKTILKPFTYENHHLIFLNSEIAKELNIEAGEACKVSNKFGSKSAKLIIDETLKNDQIGILQNLIKDLKINDGEEIDLENLKTTNSIKYIKKKLDGIALNEEEIDSIIYDVVNDNLDEATQAYFIAGCYSNQLSDEETAHLTKAIVKNGTRLQPGNDQNIIDKHCIGGVPGNRTTMVVVPIIAAAGLKIPKTSSRAITSPAGTADTMECLCNVTVEADRLEEILKEANGFISWGGGVDIAAADDKLIRLRRRVGLDPEGMMLASIMAKKFAAGSKVVLIDIPIGKQAKVKELPDAMNLKKRFENIGKLLNMQVNVIITDGSKPIGKGIGPALEAIDVMQVLNLDENAPKDLREKSLKLSGILLEMAGQAEVSQGYAMAQEILDSKKAYAKMNEIIELQGKNEQIYPFGENQKEILAETSGIIEEIDIKKLAFTTRQLGCPFDKGSGIYLHKNAGEEVKKGEKLVTLYAEDKPRLEKTLQNLDLGIIIK